MMETVLNNLYLLIEISAILLMLWALHGSKKRPGIYTVVYICISLIIEDAILFEWISADHIILLHIGVVFLNILEFKDSIKNALLFAFFDIVVVFVIQYILGMLFTVFFHVSFFATKELLILQLLFLILVFIIYRRINLKKICTILFENNVCSFILLIVLGIISILHIIRFHLWNDMNWGGVLYIAIFLLVVLGLMYEWQKENNINKQKSAELELFYQYNSIYEDFILSMRKKQHDFDNHIQAIFSMNTMATDIDSLIKQQNIYCRELLDNNRDAIFLKEDINSVYLAFIYIKKKRAEEFDIEVQCHFNCHDIEIHISFMDFITIVGNLFDNAVEAVKSENRKIIILDVLQSEKSVLIHIFNTYNFSEEELPSNFFRGKSSKGEGHGLGLSNVLDVVKQYHGIIETAFDYMNQEKFYKISLQLFWEIL